MEDLQLLVRTRPRLLPWERIFLISLVINLFWTYKCSLIWNYIGVNECCSHFRRYSYRSVLSVCLSLSPFLSPYICSSVLFNTFWCYETVLIQQLDHPTMVKNTERHYFYRVFSHIHSDFLNQIPTDGYLDILFLNTLLL